jgi:ABC-type antimicrobial peptide transport system permease subunit
MVVREGLVLASLGGVVGLLGGYGFASSIRSAVYGVTALDPLTYLGAATVLIVAAALASWIPAARAAAVEPTSALKTE